ncbi:helix-turn-helix transcriptional regulator [Candidatus Poriferisodalis sp.]|uniref:helix-turn-helix transcriptional regulator n=1 Tax=Candidatus Poriferisodalis sp. TaxID=3101277 RepID=UPI003B525108
MRPRIIRTLGQLGMEVRRLRHEAELSQEALADMAGVSRRWVGRLERGHRGAEIANVMSVVRALDMGVALVPIEDPQ